MQYNNNDDDDDHHHHHHRQRHCLASVYNMYQIMFRLVIVVVVVVVIVKHDRSYCFDGAYLIRFSCPLLFTLEQAQPIVITTSNNKYCRRRCRCVVP